MITKLNRYRNLIILFVFSIPILYLLQYFAVSPVLNYGFTPDDWGLLFFYKSLGPDPLSKIPYVWSLKGAYTTSQVYFIGTLNHFFNLDYQAYQITNIILKTLATLSLYPLILIVFKRRSLAFLTTIIYGLSYMASRSLEYVVKGTDYLAIIPMNIFFIIYYCIVTGRFKGLFWFVLMSLFWFSSLMISPIRIYPILVLVPLIEIYLWIQYRSKKGAFFSIKRLSVLYLPFLLIFLFKPNSILSFLRNPHVLYQPILNGNWHLILTPFQGVGLSVIFSEEWYKIFGNIDLSSLRNYSIFLLGAPLFIFGVLTIFLSVIKFKKRLRFFILTFGISLILFIGFYFIGIHELSISESLRLHFDPARMYPILISGFMLAISFASFVEWKSLGKKDSLLLGLWISTPIILLYTFLIWLLAPFGVGFEGQQGYYLVVPTIATSLFLASFLVIILDKALKQRTSFSRLMVLLTFFISLIFIYLTNSYNTYHYYISAGINGRYFSDQEKLFSQILNNLGNNFRSTDTIFFYFDLSEDGQQRTFYAESLFLNLASRLQMKSANASYGCVGVFYEDLPSLAKLVKVKDGIKGFVYPAQCGVAFYKINNFYAFKAKNGVLIDTTSEVLKELGFK